MTARAGFVVWFTGLSGSGKSTLATLLSAELAERGVHVEVLDGDEVRQHLSKGLGFSREDRDTNVRRIGFVAKLLARAGACAMTAAISPYRAGRDEVRREIGRFVEVYCRCSIDVLTARDPKGLYVKALAGEIAHFSGVTDPYEEPLAPDVVVDTATESKEESLRRIVETIERLGFIEPRVSRTAATRPLTGLPVPHGGALLSAPVVAAPLGARTLSIGSGDRVWLELAAAGALSPVAGPLGEKDATRVRKEMRLESGKAWPLAWVLPIPWEAAPGEVLLVEGTALGLSVRETWDAGGERFVAASVVRTEALETGGGPEATRDRVTTLGGGATGIVLRSALDPDALDRVVASIPAGGPVVLLAAGPAGRASADAIVLSAGAAARAVIVDLPVLPALGSRRDLLLDVLLLRNHGAARAVLPDPPEGDDTLAAFTPAELGVEIVPAAA